MAGSRWPVASSDADFAPYLEGRPATVTEMFWRFVELARATGPATFELQNGPVVLRGTRRIFASARPMDRGLSGHLNLLRPLADRRIRKVEPLTRTVLFHRYWLTELSDLDEEFGQWLRQAHAVGDGLRVDDSR